MVHNITKSTKYTAIMISLIIYTLKDWIEHDCEND